MAARRAASTRRASTDDARVTAHIELALPPTHPRAARLVEALRAVAARLAPAAKFVTRESAEPELSIDGRRVASGERPLEVWQLEAALLGARVPRHLLFMCLANSARSQLAEGLARASAPEGVRVSSAGSRPAFVHPLSVVVLAELGIDISSHFSKAIESVDTDSVDAVITLCAEQVCPVPPRAALCVDWALADPSRGAHDAEQARLGFRRTRDELRERIALLFSFWPR